MSRCCRRARTIWHQVSWTASSQHLKLVQGSKEAASYGSITGQVPVAEHPPPSDLNHRRLLQYYSKRESPTDFEPWMQGEMALASGARVEDMVRREFTRDFGPHSVQYVPCFVGDDL